MGEELQQRQLLEGMLESRQNALHELEEVSPELYSKAVELNPALFPFEWKGPTETPPIPTYIPPDPEE